jgi:hypothetical protein
MGINEPNPTPDNEAPCENLQLDPVATILSKRLVFLVGVPRSGTTWLQLMLASSNLVASVNETHLFSSYMRSLFTEWTFWKKNSRPIGLHEFIGEEEYLAMLRDFACSVMIKILAKKPAAEVVLEKTPRHIKYWSDILRIFPDAYFLHLVRDPRSVVSSLLSANREWGQAWGSTDAVEWCERWGEDVTLAKQLEKNAAHYKQVRYEDLQASGVQTLSSVFSWMGVKVGSDECSKIFADHAIDNLRANRLDGAAWNLSTEPKGFFRLGETDSWKRDLTPRQAYLVERLCDKLMVDLGYTPVTKSKMIFPLVARSYIKRTAAAALPRLMDSYRRFVLRRGYRKPASA